MSGGGEETETLNLDATFKTHNGTQCRASADEGIHEALHIQRMSSHATSGVCACIVLTYCKNAAISK